MSNHDHQNSTIDQEIQLRTCTYPLAPMEYINLYTDENIKNGRAPPPPPIIKVIIILSLNLKFQTFQFCRY
jgi:hypothetical protein